MAKLRREHVMIAREMIDRHVSIREMAAKLDVDESTLRYRLNRPPEALDGRRDRATVLDGWSAVVTAVLERFGDARVSAGSTTRCPTRVVFDVLLREYGFSGSYQAVRRHLQRTYGPAPVQAIRRVETPAGVQAQHDWFEWKGTLAGECTTLYGLIGTLSFSRATFVWVSRTMAQLAWQTGHLALFQRYGGVPLWVRLDNLRTAVAVGAGSHAVLNRTFARFAGVCGFSLDPCRPAMGSDKGKVERGVRTERSAFADLFLRAWESETQLQQALDQRAAELHTRRRCPVTGTTVAEALVRERPLLQPVPAIHEPFDVVVARRVSRDCLVSFEGRRYSVPFAWVNRLLEVRGTAQHVVLLGEGRELARHPRGTARRLVLDAAHYEGDSTPSVVRPTPLGMRARLQLSGVGLPAPTAIARPLSAYVALVEEALR
ncbi:MAG: IS21 family transposase [Gemmatimonadaceae bacterium]